MLLHLLAPEEDVEEEQEELDPEEEASYMDMLIQVGSDLILLDPEVSVTDIVKPVVHYTLFLLSRFDTRPEESCDSRQLL